MRINHNIQALNAYSKLSKNQFATGKALEKLSSGLRINRAADDAAGLAISEKMRGQIRGLQQAEKNAMDGISLIQTAEGALAEVHDMLSRMRELAVQGANGTLTETDRKVIQDEIDQLREQIDRIGNDTQFNTKKLLNGSLSENANIRSLYGDVEYSKKGAGLRDIKVDAASVLPQDVYSLKVVTESKTLNMDGITDTHKTGLENFLLSPDSLLADGEYKLVVKSSMHYAETDYKNASDLNASDASVTNGKYLIEYSKADKKATLFALKEDGTKDYPIETTTVTVPPSPNDTRPQMVSFGTNGKVVTFILSDPTKDARVEFEKNVSISNPTAPVLGSGVSEIEVTGNNLVNGKYTVSYDQATGKAKLLNGAGETVAEKTIPTSGAQTVDFGNGVKVKIDDASSAIGATSFEKFGEFPGKVLKQGTLPSNLSLDVTNAPGGSYTIEYAINDPADFTPSVANVTYSANSAVFANNTIQADATVAADTWKLTKTANPGEYKLTNGLGTVNDTVMVGTAYNNHGLSFTITSTTQANTETITFVTSGSGTPETLSTNGEGYLPSNTGGKDAVFAGNKIEIESNVETATWTLTTINGATQYKLTNSTGTVDDIIDVGTAYNNHGLKFTITSAGTMVDGDQISFSTKAPGATATLKDANGITIASQSFASPTGAPNTVTFSNGLKATFNPDNIPVSATKVNVEYKQISSYPDLSKSTLEDGYYKIESDGVDAYLYQTTKDGTKIGDAIDKITNVGPGSNTFPNKKVSFTGEVGVITFKQSTEYEIDLYKKSDDPLTSNPIAKKTSVHFGDEAIDLVDDNGTSYGLTVDFNNAAAGYVKRGGALPEAPASDLPLHSFAVGSMKRTSVILKDSTEKVIAHQFVDNDRKFIELGNTGISFGTGVLSHNETATKIDVRQTLEDASITFQIGTNAGEVVALGIGDIRTKALGIDKFKLTDETSASNAIAIIDSAIDKVSEIRSKLGAYQNRMEHTVNNITQSNENLTAAESRIRDADMAKEMAEFTKYNIINQSATAMLAQANQLPQGILQLLKG